MSRVTFGWQLAAELNHEKYRSIESKYSKQSKNYRLHFTILFFYNYNEPINSQFSSIWSRRKIRRHGFWNPHPNGRDDGEALIGFDVGN